MFTNVLEAINWLENIKRKDKRTDLSRITKILNDFDNPQKNYMKIHVTGTNGKGSVCHILNTCLQTKYKVGVFSSPYIVKFNERIKFNNEYIEDDILLQFINEVYVYSEKYNKENDDIIPFFELTFLISLLYFKFKKVDIAIIEVGVGGLLDSTNCFNYELSLITNVGLDHTATLGDNLESISNHKLGILKEGNTLYTSVDEELIPHFKKYCRKNKVKQNYIIKKDISIIKQSITNTTFIYNDFTFTTSLLGVHQVFNLSLAINVLNDYFKFSYFEINKFIKNITFNGRFEIISTNPLTIVDGAHNIDGITSLVSTVKALFNEKVNFCFAAMKDKETEKMINQIESVAKTISFTQINYYRTQEALEFKSNLENVNYYTNIEDAIKELQNKNETVIYTGSLYFISEIRKILSKHHQ